jgi:hypothetical protein
MSTSTDGVVTHHPKRPEGRRSGDSALISARYWLRDFFGFCREHLILTIVTLAIIVLIVFLAADELERVLAQNSTSGFLRSTLTWFATNSDGQLSAIGIVLFIVVGICWYLSNRHEATPNADQLEEMRHFVTGHFASYVARGLAAEGVSPDEVSIAYDPAWRRIFLQHLKLHNELYAFRTSIAMKVFETYVDDAVRASLIAAQQAGHHADATVMASQGTV